MALATNDNCGSESPDLTDFPECPALMSQEGRAEVNWRR